MTDRKFHEGDLVEFDTGRGTVTARVFRTCAHKVWLDHYTFERARVVSDTSPKLGRVLA